MIACLLGLLLLLSAGQAVTAFADTNPDTYISSWTPYGMPTQAYSGTGSWLTEIRYYPDGRIASLSEQIGRTVEHWEYRYDNAGGFLYRVKDIGSVPSQLAAGRMPGTDLNYSALSSTVYDCVGFTLDYEVTKVRKGDGIGDRYLFTYDGYVWSLAGTFAYDSYGRTSASFEFYRPITVVNFTTPRIYADDSSFLIEQSLRNILVADYTYVCPDTMEPLPSRFDPSPWYPGHVPAPAPAPVPGIGPGPADLAGQEGVSSPHGSWLTNYESQVVRGTVSGNAYLRWSPSNEGREYKRYVSEGEWVTVLARESGYSLVLTRDGRAGWVTSSLLAYK
jgi:hypothetical protein